MLSSPSSSPSPEELAFLQKRVARFGLFGAALSFAFWAFRLWQAVIFPNTSDLLLEPSFGLHMLAWVCLLSVWVINRRGKHPHRLVHWSETLGLIGACLAYVWMGTFIPLPARPEMIVLSALTLALAARAAYVPSTARHTLGICLAVGVPYVWVTYESHSAISPEYLALLSPPAEQQATAHQYAQMAAVTAGVWWALSTSLCTGINELVYGLRRQVRNVKKLGQYIIEEKLGEGGMGVVYRAQHGMLRRPTAIKLLHPEVAKGATLKRFEREVRLTAKLTHPNTVTIYDYGRTPDGLFYYAMELLEGAHLGDIVAVDGEQDPARVVAILSSVASALREAHGIGLIHRDIKPANIILCVQGGVHDVAKVVDFGLVKEVATLGKADGLTQEDTITGTPQYMSPEAIARPNEIDARSDLYALGAVGYYLLTGTHVFGGGSIVEVCSHHLHTPPEPPSARRDTPIPPDLEALVLACLAKDPDDRPASAAALVQRLCALKIDRWTEPQAEAWWETHRGALEERHRRSAISHTRAIEVARHHTSWR